MTIYRVLIKGLTKETAPQVEAAIATLPGLMSLSMIATDDFAVITIDSDLDAEGVMAMVRAVVAAFGCTVQLLTRVSKPETLNIHRFLFVFQLVDEEDAEVLYHWDQAFRLEFGDAFELTWAHEPGEASAVMGLTLQSFLTRTLFLDRLERIGQNMSFEIEVIEVGEMDDKTPTVLMPKPTTVKKPGLR